MWQLKGPHFCPLTSGNIDVTILKICWLLGNGICWITAKKKTLALVGHHIEYLDMSSKWVICADERITVQIDAYSYCQGCSTSFTQVKNHWVHRDTTWSKKEIWVEPISRSIRWHMMVIWDNILPGIMGNPRNFHVMKENTHICVMALNIHSPQTNPPGLFPQKIYVE